MTQNTSFADSHHALSNDLERNDLERIDTSVTPYGKWYTVANTTFILAVIVLTIIVSSRANLAWWMPVLVLLTIIFALAFLYTKPRVLIYLTSPKLYHIAQADNGQGQWQLVWQTLSRQELWEAKLLHCQCYGRCIQMSFIVTHPMPVNLTQVIWQDQVSAEAWRRLSALARW